MKLAWWKKENTPDNVKSVFCPYRLYEERDYMLLGSPSSTMDEALRRCDEKHTHILEVRSDMKIIWHQIHARLAVVKAVSVDLDYGEETKKSQQRPGTEEYCRRNHCEPI